MICKKDVILWFKELESYKRIDTMCTLLNMCLPFELRFLGTCLEELGRRDSQELRGIELRVNNPQDLASDMIACQKGEPTDKKIRRKMALYLALIRACNRTCVTEIFRTLDGWGERDFLGMNDPDTLQELLLVYIMAANHPVFSFEQHMKCTEIFEKIKENKLVCEQPSSPLLHQHVDQALASSGPHPHDLRQQLQPSHQELLHQHAFNTMQLTGQHPSQLLTTPPLQMLPQGTIPLSYSQPHISKLIPADGNIQHQITVDGIPHMISSNITIPADSSTILAHPSATWALRPYPPPGPAVDHPPQSSSPMLSQQSSPASSRAASPNRATNSNIIQQQGMPPQQQQVRNMSQRIGATLKNVRRPSAETTPPPISQQHPQMMANEIVLPQNMKHVDEVIMNNEQGSGMQLQTLIRNGFTRSGHHPRIKAGNFIQPHQPQPSPVNQHFQAIAPGNFALNAGLTYSIQNMSIADASSAGPHAVEGAVMSINSNKSVGSDSGSSIGSSGEISPPETPTLLTSATTNASSGLRMSNDQTQQQQQQQQVQQQKHHQQPINYNKQINLTRLNGRSDKLIAANVGGSNVSGASIIYAQAAALSNTHQPMPQQQQSQQIFGTDIILAPGGNAGAANLMQATSLANNNNSGAPITTNTNNASSNNNIVSNTVLISSPSAPGSGSLIGNVITSNSVLMQSHQQQYNASYPYHAAAQQFATTARPPLLAHNPAMAPPPPGSYRLPGFQIPPNGELIYPAYHPAGITFLSGGTPQVTLRSTNAPTVSTNATPPQLPQPTPQPLQAAQAPLPTPAILATAPYSTLTVGVAKPVSCYNCGSQAHTGRDCQEASMDDVTRNAIYKLDYSVAAGSNNSPTTGATGGGNGTSDAAHTPTATHQQKQPQQQQQQQQQSQQQQQQQQTQSLQQQQQTQPQQQQQSQAQSQPQPQSLAQQQGMDSGGNAAASSTQAAVPVTLLPTAGANNTK